MLRDTWNKMKAKAPRRSPPASAKAVVEVRDDKAPDDPDWMALVIDAVSDGANASRRKALEEVIRLAVELAHEGTEGRKVGALFIVGDCEAVLAQSRPMVLDPLHGHPPELRYAGRRKLRETIKELAQIDGSFIVDDEGVFVSAGGLSASISLRHRSFLWGSGPGTRPPLPSPGGPKRQPSPFPKVRSFASSRVASCSPRYRPWLFLGNTKSSFSVTRPRVYELPNVGLTVAVADARDTDQEAATG
jgi:hypothetical protein